MFSMISDPAYVARANAAFDSAWDAIKSTVEAGSLGERDAQLRLRLFIESYSLVADSERDLTKRALDRFRKMSMRDAVRSEPNLQSVRSLKSSQTVPI